ncbi:hypothetical protein pb186bvf_013117 [Paramecium bursaria]
MLQKVIRNIFTISIHNSQILQSTNIFDISQIAAQFNRKIDATQQLINYHQKQEQQIIMEGLYQQILINDKRLLDVKIDGSEFEKYLDDQGRTYIQELISKSTNYAYLRLVRKHSFYFNVLLLRSISTKKRFAKLQKDLQPLQDEMLNEQDFINLLYKLSILWPIQTYHPQIVERLLKLSQRQDVPTNKELLVFAHIIFKYLSYFGQFQHSDQLLTQLIKWIKKVTLTTEDKLALLHQSFHLADVKDLRKYVQNPLIEGIQNISLDQYPLVLSSLANSCSKDLDMAKEEQFIVKNLDHFQLLRQKIQLLKALVWTQSKNFELIDQIISSIKIIEEEDIKYKRTLCSLYQILFVVERLYNHKIKYANLDYNKLKNVYFHTIQFENTNNLSIVQDQVNSILKQIQVEQQSKSDMQYKIKNIQTCIQVEIYVVDFVIDLENKYKKRQIMLDCKKVGYLSGKQQIRQLILQSPDYVVLDINKFKGQTDKREQVEKLLGL